MISLICGPMFGGKTTELLRRLERAYLAKKKVVLLRPNTDSRSFLTHSPKDISWLEEVFVDDLNKFDAKEYDIIGIDEGQFHNNLANFSTHNNSLEKNIIISSLLATSECEMFDSIIEVLPYCDEIFKLNAICTRCGSEQGNYSYYLAGNKEKKVEVGGINAYTALCRNCYLYKRAGWSSWE